MKDELIRVRISAQKKEEAKRQAEKQGLSLSEYILSLIYTDLKVNQ